MDHTATDYEAAAEECLNTAEGANVGTHQAAYWLARAQVYATLAAASALAAHSGSTF